MTDIANISNEPIEPVVPVEPAAVVDPAAAVEPPPLHPAWQRTFEEAGIPEMLQPKLIEQVRRSEAAANKAIEDAKKAAVPDEWRSFLDGAQQAGATPEELTTSWNAAQAIREDPIKFLDSFSSQVDKLVQQGVLTRAQGAEKKQDAVDAVNDQVNLTSPEAQKIAELEQTIQQIQGTQTAAEQQAAYQRSVAESEAYADHFMTVVNGSLASLGITGDPASDAVANQMQGIIGRMADSLVANDQTGKMTPEQAVAAAVQQVAAATGRTVGVPATAPTPSIPVHGGGAATTPTAPRKFASQAEREAAMLEVGRSFQQQQ